MYIHKNTALQWGQFRILFRLLLRWVLVHGVLAWGPYGPIWAHMGPYGPLWAHMGPYGTIWVHKGPYGPIRAHMGPTLKHHVLKPTLAAADMLGIVSHGLWSSTYDRSHLLEYTCHHAPDIAIISSRTRCCLTPMQVDMHIWRCIRLPLLIQGY